jgi:Tfp pilus assembly protein PilF
LNNHAVSLLDLGKKQEALATLERALQLDAHHPESVYNKALLEWRDESITDDEVVRRLKEAKQASWRAGLYLGFIHLERASADEAGKRVNRRLQVENWRVIILPGALW